MTTVTPHEANEADVTDKGRSLSWMVSMSIAAGELQAAEGYLLELLAWVAFGSRQAVVTT